MLQECARIRSPGQDIFSISLLQDDRMSGNVLDQIVGQEGPDGAEQTENGRDDKEGIEADPLGKGDILADPEIEGNWQEDADCIT